MDKLLTLQEVAARFQVDVRTVRRWLKEGYISGCRPGGRIIRIDANSLDHLYEEVHYGKRIGSQEDIRSLLPEGHWRDVIAREREFIAKLQAPRKNTNKAVQSNV